MKEKLFLIFTEGGYIGTVTWIETASDIYAFADLYGVFQDGGNLYLDTEIHKKLMFPKSSEEHEVLNGILGSVIRNYDVNGYTYHWRDITPSNFDSHPKK